jgi:hypothetical protein
MKIESPLGGRVPDKESFGAGQSGGRWRALGLVGWPASCFAVAWAPRNDPISDALASQASPTRPFVSNIITMWGYMWGREGAS